ncbi:ATP-dependent DNA helicase [Heracleum sosnowskyi]|uniref:ATP-dependent DNA helicase n=1 Tax=Heracleum sosnowskyi TaxID=360622 RepID=A0AAD8J2L3_9APIA|nr:ATP-dependent DNA helicase [Heracleum sosnowskyi]
MPRQLRLLFVYIIVNCQVKDVLQLWRSHWRCLCEDVVYQQRRLTRNNDLQLSDNQMEFYGLAEIEKLLGAIGKSLKKIPTKWVLDIGDGKLDLPSNEYSQYDQYIEIPSKYCIQSPIASIDDVITSTYDGLENSYKSTTYLRERAILTPTNQVVNHLNDLIMDKIPGDPIVYYSSDMVQDDGTGEQGNSTFPIEYLNTIKISGLPVHELRLKEGIVVMLMRNLSQTLGLCNGTRLIVRKCMKHTVQCEVLSGNNVGAIHLIPRLDMCPSDTKLPFNFVRKQFPLQVCFAMTINKAQGQSLSKVGLYLPKPVFCHGQLYVAISRVTSPYGLKVYIETDHGSTTSITKNVVFEEIFYKLPTT